MHLSDALSRLTSHNDNSKAKSIPGLDITVHDVQVFTEISPLSLEKIKCVTENDPDLKTLKQYIQNGFPVNRSDCVESVQGYFGFREELAIVNGLIVKGHWVVIPSQLCDEALKLLDSSHMGIVKTKDRARTSFFWPNMNQEIKAHLSECHPCATFQEKQPKETLLNDPVSNVQRKSLAMDNFDFNGKHYLIVVNRFSKFVIVKPSKDLTSRTTINLLLDIFSEHGFPATIRCDRGHNFVSNEFVDFCKKLNISITLSSGYHHSSNPAEHAVKTVKSLMKHCLASNTSWRIALLEYLSTPLSSNVPSPSELMGRQFQGLLPFFQDHGTPESVTEQIMLQKEKEKCRHDVSAHDLPVIPVGATVAYINKDLKTWSIGKVEKHENHSYAILTEEGRLVSHNRVHLYKTNVSFSMSTTSPNKSFVPKFDMPIKPLNMNNQAGQPTITPKPKANQTTVSTPPKVELRTK